MLIRVNVVEGCDATTADSSTTDGKIKIVIQNIFLKQVV